MKSSMLCIAVIAAMFFVAIPLRGQDTLPYHLGAGISVEPALFGQNVFTVSGSSGPYLLTTPLFSVSPYYIYVPVPITKNFRLEPRFGIYSYSYDSETPGSPSSSYKNDVAMTHVGLSAEYVIPAGQKFQLYVGPRVGLNFLSQSSTSYQYTGTGNTNVTYTTTETDFVASGIFGAEYFPLNGLSVGGEVDLNFVSFGNPDETQSPATNTSPSPTTVTRSLFSTGALFFLRWYFL